MGATSWTEMSQNGDTWVNDIYGADFSGEFIVIGDAVVPATADGTPASMASASSVTWTELSQGSATSFSEMSQTATTWTEDAG